MTSSVLTDTERSVLSALDERSSELLAFACELIATPSPNPPGDERAVAALVAAKLRELGIDEVEMVGATEEHPNLIASVCSRSGGSTLILSGHLDTKPPGDLSAWRRDPYSPVIEHGELYGLGSGDMKVALAAMVYAAAAVRAASAQGSLMLVFTADEEAGSVHGSQWLAESGRLQADAAVIGEPCGIVREWESIDILLGPDLHRLASMSFVASVVAFILATPSTLVAPPGVSVHHA